MSIELRQTIVRLRGDATFLQKNMPCGSSVASDIFLVCQAAEQAEARVAELEGQLADWKHSADNAMDERHDADEHHCTCVPVLRSRIRELEEYKRRVELSIKACSAFTSDELIRRKQAEALRRWDEQKVDGMSALEYADAIRRGEVEI